MQYDFDTVIDRRGTNALSTDGFRGYIFHAGPEAQFKFADEDFVRMWVADMEFATAPEIREALCARVNHGILGYTQLFSEDYPRAFAAWCEAQYGWRFAPEELCISAGIIPMLYELVGDLTAPDERVLTLTPSYGYFLHAAEFNHRALVTSALKNEDGCFSVDWDDLERKAADPKVRVLIWCNPHNPTGRMWTAEETARMGEIAQRHGLWIISDEIHCDLLRTGLRHLPTGAVLKDYPRLITCMAASKTFNLAGLMFSSILIRDAQLRETVAAHSKNGGDVNPLSLAATQAAYTQGGPWLTQLKAYLDENFRVTAQRLRDEAPNAVFRIPQATYLAWVDLRRCLPAGTDLSAFFADAGVLLEGGNNLFVGNAEGFVRLNLAMPRSMLQTGLTRICGALNAAQ